MRIQWTKKKNNKSRKTLTSVSTNFLKTVLLVTLCKIEISSKMADFYRLGIILWADSIKHNRTQWKRYKGIRLTWVVRIPLMCIIVSWILNKLDLHRGQLPLRFKLWDRVTNFKDGLKETEISKLAWAVRLLTLILFPEKEYFLMNKAKLKTPLPTNKW